MHETSEFLMQKLKHAGRLVQVGGLYWHYKNPDLKYRVLQLAIIEANDEICVIYEAQYGEKLIFVRPLSNWLEKAEQNGQYLARFTRCEEKNKNDRSK